MKKNMISVIILALLIVNIVLTAVMLFSVTSTNKATADMVMKITGALDMEVSSVTGESASQRVPIENTVTYDIADKTILLKRGEDNTDYYMMLSIVISMNSAHEDYKKYGGDMESRQSAIESRIDEVVSNYTIEEARADQEGMKEAILESIQEMFNSDFVFKVDFNNVKFSG